MVHNGSLAMAKYWKYNKKTQIRDLSDDVLKEEWESIKIQAKEFYKQKIPWTDELFFCFYGFAQEVTRRFFKK